MKRRLALASFTLGVALTATMPVRAQDQDYKIAKEERDANLAREAATKEARRQQLRFDIQRAEQDAASAQSDLDYAMSAAPQLESNVYTLRSNLQSAQYQAQQCYNQAIFNVAQVCSWYINNENNLRSQLNDAIGRHNTNNNNWNNAANRVNRANDRASRLQNELDRL